MKHTGKRWKKVILRREGLDYQISSCDQRARDLSLVMHLGWQRQYDWVAVVHQSIFVTASVA